MQILTYCLEKIALFGSRGLVRFLCHQAQNLIAQLLSTTYTVF